jgi:nitrite reductase/ring-hydroxylating ferredoxin subunit
MLQLSTAKNGVRMRMDMMSAKVQVWRKEDDTSPTPYTLFNVPGQFHALQQYESMHATQNECAHEESVVGSSNSLIGLKKGMRSS